MKDENEERFESTERKQKRWKEKQRLGGSKREKKRVGKRGTGTGTGTEREREREREREEEDVNNIFQMREEIEIRNNLLMKRYHLLI